MQKEFSLIPLPEALPLLSGTNERTAYRMLHRGDLPSVKIGERYFIDRVKLEKMIEGGGCERRKRGRPTVQPRRAA